MTHDHPTLPFSGAPAPIPVRRRMARRRDPEPSHAAAEVVRAKLNRLQVLVLDAFAQRGPMTAREAERLPSFNAYGFSTIRKRISELAAAGHLVAIGTDRSRGAPATIYRVNEGADHG